MQAAIEGIKSVFLTDISTADKLNNLAEVCNEVDIKKLTKYIISKADLSKYSTDLTHLNSDGQRLLGECIAYQMMHL